MEQTIGQILKGQGGPAVIAQNSHPNPDADSSRINAFKYHFLQVANAVCPGFTIQDTMRSTILDIFNWCMMIPGNLDPEKGLWLWGDIGTGKTTMLKIVKRFCRDARPRDEEGERYGFGIFTAADIAARFTRDGYPGIEEILKSRRLAIDEVGRESLESGHYGNTVNVIRQVLQSRYDNRCTHFTHVTSNLLHTDSAKTDEVAIRYGEHIYDRCREIFNFVRFHGKTFRKQ